MHVGCQLNLSNIDAKTCNNLFKISFCNAIFVLLVSFHFVKIPKCFTIRNWQWNDNCYPVVTFDFVSVRWYFRQYPDPTSHLCKALLTCTGNAVTPKKSHHFSLTAQRKVSEFKLKFFIKRWKNRYRSYFQC